MFISQKKILLFIYRKYMCVCVYIYIYIPKKSIRKRPMAHYIKEQSIYIVHKKIMCINFSSED